MGGGSYNFESRNTRASTSNYKSVTTDSATFHKVFEQQAKGTVHEDMSPFSIKPREAFDSEAHPNPLPIILGLDVTGSMGDLPKELCAEGLPKIMGKLLQAGVDPALCFTAIGDHEYDKYPFQVGQFESGDEELDKWLTRTYLEGGGGGNGGESYLLAWFFAAFLTDTHSWSKRKRKGFIFTFGDEPNLKILPKESIKKIFNIDVEKDFTADELLKLASEKYHVYHVNIRHGYRTDTCLQLGWRNVLGENAIDVNGVSKVADAIVDTIGRFEKNSKSNTKPDETPTESKPTQETPKPPKTTPIL